MCNWPLGAMVLPARCSDVAGLNSGSGEADQEQAMPVPNIRDTTQHYLMILRGYPTMFLFTPRSSGKSRLVRLAYERAQSVCLKEW